MSAKRYADLMAMQIEEPSGKWVLSTDYDSVIAERDQVLKDLTQAIDDLERRYQEAKYAGETHFANMLASFRTMLLIIAKEV